MYRCLKRHDEPSACTTNYFIPHKAFTFNIINDVPKYVQPKWPVNMSTFQMHNSYQIDFYCTKTIKESEINDAPKQ